MSRPCRGQGIGKLLFERVCQAVIERSAKKLYIEANPAVDTYHFYKAMGCILAEEMVPEVYEAEPLDLHLNMSYRILRPHRNDVVFFMHKNAQLQAFPPVKN